MEDIEQAAELVARTAGNIGMTRNELRVAIELLQKYGEERDRLFNEMLTSLDPSSGDNIVDAWKNSCDSGSASLEALNSAIPSSQIGEGLNGIGAGDFYQGERKVWSENGKALIAVATAVLAGVLAANAALIDQCDDDLKSIRDGGAVVQAAVSSNLANVRSGFLDLATTIKDRRDNNTLTSWIKDGSATTYLTEWTGNVVVTAEETLRVAQQKAILRKQLIDNIELLSNERERLDDNFIDETYASAEDCAKSLVSETGVYLATNWAQFGESCMGRLALSRDGAKAKSAVVFGEILPKLLEESTTSFAALTNDPSELESWKSELQEQLQSIKAALTAEDDVIQDLAEGAYQETTRAAFESFDLAFSSTVELLFDKILEATTIVKA